MKTWIIITITFVVLVFLLILRTIYSSLKKGKTDIVANKEDKYNYFYEYSFITLVSLYNFNDQLLNNKRKNKNYTVSDVNTFMKNKLTELINSPFYIFNVCYREFYEKIYVLCNKLLKIGSYDWKKKFIKDFIVLEVMTEKFIEDKQSLGETVQIIESNIKSDWSKEYNDE